MALRDAAFYWNGLSPRQTMPVEVKDWFNALCAAVKSGDLQFQPKYSDRVVSKQRDYQRQKENAWIDTVVTRDQLKEFAAPHNYHPVFLTDI